MYVAVGFGVDGDGATSGGAGAHETAVDTRKSDARALRMVTRY